MLDKNEDSENKLRNAKLSKSLAAGIERLEQPITVYDIVNLYEGLALVKWMVSANLAITAYILYLLLTYK